MGPEGIAETIRPASSDSARLALLHLAHPATFEAIVSPGHKVLVAKRFADVAGDEADIDRRLLAARAALTAQYGDGFSWYDDPLVHCWWKDTKAWSAFLGWLQRLGATDADRVEARRNAAPILAAVHPEPPGMTLTDP